MKTINTLRLFVLSTTCLMPLTVATAQEGDFGISEEPVEKPVPVYDSYVETGVGLASDNADRLGRFSGLHDDGAHLLGSFQLLQRAPRDGEETWFVRANGRNLGLESRRMDAEGGEQGLWKLKADYQELPYSRFGDGLTAHTGVGTGNLTLVPGWVRANNIGLLRTNGSLARRNPVDIQTERTKYGIGLTWNIDKAYTLSVKTQREEKDGLKPLGVPFGGGGGSNGLSALVPEPIDYVTEQLETQLGYAGRDYQWRVGYQIQRFENDIDSLTVQNPINGGTSPTRMGLAPDNFAHAFNADGGYDLSDKTRLTGNFSYSQYRQDELFLPYSLTVNGALPRRSADALVNITTGNVELSHRFDNLWDVKTRYRYTDRDNQTPTALYGYAAVNGDTQIALNAAGARRNVPYSYLEHLVTNDVGYQLMPKTKVTAGYDLRFFERSYTEREDQTDHTGRIGVRSTLADGVIANAKYARMWRSGSTYDWQKPFLAAFPNQPTTALDNHYLLRKFDRADVERDTVSGGVTVQPIDPVSLGFNGSLFKDDYGNSQVGLTDTYGYSATLDASYAVSEMFTLSSFYTYDRRDSHMFGWTFNNTATATDRTRRWWQQMEDDSHTTGLTGEWKVRDDLRLFLDYVYSDARTRINNGTGGSGALTAPRAFEEIHYRTHGFGLRTQYDLTDNIEIGLGYMYERVRSNDWQLDASPADASSYLTLAEQSPDEDRHLVLMTTRYKF